MIHQHHMSTQALVIKVVVARLIRTVRKALHMSVIVQKTLGFDY